MTSLILILASLTLLLGFSALTWYEARQGERFFASWRARLDRRVDRLLFVLTHVNFSVFLQEEMRLWGRRAGHFTAHTSLQLVRAIERALARLVRHFRTQQAHDETVVSNGSTREFVKTLSHFKGRLKETRPPIPEIR